MMHFNDGRAASKVMRKIGLEPGKNFLQQYDLDEYLRRYFRACNSTFSLHLPLWMVTMTKFVLKNV